MSQWDGELESVDGGSIYIYEMEAAETAVGEKGARSGRTVVRAGRHGEAKTRREKAK